MVISTQKNPALINPVLRKQVEPEKTHVFKTMEIHFLLIFYLSTSPVFKGLFSQVFNFRVCLGLCFFSAALTARYLPGKEAVIYGH